MSLIIENILPSFSFSLSSIILIPEIFFSLSIILFILYTSLVFSKLYIFTKYTNKLVLCIVSIMLLLNLNVPSFNITLITNSFFQDKFIVINKIILLVSLMGCLFISEESLVEIFELSILIMLSLFGLLLLMMSFDLISVYLAIEIQSLCFYIMATLKRNSAFSTEAGLKYFIIGAFASGILLFGCSLIYFVTGTTNFEQLSLFFINSSVNSLAIIGSIFILIAIFIKLAVAPFHMWSPDVYEGSFTNISVFFAVVPKLSLLIILIRFFNFIFYEYFELIYWWSFLGEFCGILSVIFGSLTAIKQKRIKRLLAYSSIGHVGYLMLSLFSGTYEGLQAVFFYIILYIITSLGIWGSFLAIYNNNYTTKIRYISELKSIFVLNPFLSLSFAICLFSLAGIPPLSGFLAKLMVFISLINNSFYLIGLFSILVSVISTFYYLRVVKIIFFEKNFQFNKNIFYHSPSKFLSLVISVSILLIVLFFIFPNFLYLNTYFLSLICF